MSMKIKPQSDYNYRRGNVHAKGRKVKKGKDNNLQGSGNDPFFSKKADAQAEVESRNAGFHYHDNMQSETYKIVNKERKKGRLESGKKDSKDTFHYHGDVQSESNKRIAVERKKGRVEGYKEDSEDSFHYHEDLQSESNKVSKQERKKGKKLYSREESRKAKEEWDQYQQDTKDKPKTVDYYESKHDKNEETDEAQLTRTTKAQEATTPEIEKIGSKKTLTIDSKLEIAPDGKGYLHVTFSDPSIEELYRTYTPSVKDLKDLDISMDKFFLSPLKRDMTLRVMVLYLTSLAKEFASQLDYDIVQTKLKVSSIMSQKDEIKNQATTKLIGGVAESFITGAAAGISIRGSGKGLYKLGRKTASTKKEMLEADKLIESADKTIETNKGKLQNLQDQKKEMDQQNMPKDDPKYKKVEADIETTEKAISEKTSVKKGALAARSKAEEDQRTTLREIDFEVAKLNGYSQLVGSGRGLLTGMTDYYVMTSQANVKLQDALQAGIQLTKDNARMFMQKSNEYITSLLSSLLSIINATYQARRGIITS